LKSFKKIKTRPYKVRVFYFYNLFPALAGQEKNYLPTITPLADQESGV